MIFDRFTTAESHSNSAKAIIHPPGEDYKLSEREIEMLGHLVNGLSYKMIADQRGISQYPVNAHMRNIHKKLQVHSVAEAVSKALSQGLVLGVLRNEDAVWEGAYLSKQLNVRRKTEFRTQYFE